LFNIERSEFVCQHNLLLTTTSSLLYFIPDVQCDSALLSEVPDEMITASSQYDCSYAPQNALFSIRNAAWCASQAEYGLSELNFWIQVRFLG